MPGNVAAAAPSTVLPKSLCLAFSQAREWPTVQNDYPSGENQRSVQTTVPRRSWSLSKRLAPADAGALLSFFIARKNGLEPFFFYDFSEGSTLFNYDATGVSSIGRFTVRFNGEFRMSLGIARCDASFRLVEVA